MSQTVRTLIVLIALAVTTHPASARDRNLPPAQYDHPHPNLTVLELPPAVIAEVCRRYVKAPFPLKACTPQIGDGKSPCVIVIPKRATPSSTIYRHERAHCNGWPANHPR